MRSERLNLFHYSGISWLRDTWFVTCKPTLCKATCIQEVNCNMLHQHLLTFPLSVLQWTACTAIQPSLKLLPVLSLAVAQYWSYILSLMHTHLIIWPEKKYRTFKFIKSTFKSILFHTDNCITLLEAFHSHSKIKKILWNFQDPE